MNKRTLKAYTTSPWRLNGRHWEAPVTMMTETVACGSNGCLFWPADTIEAMARAWNGVAVCLNHPMVDGCPVSINHNPEIRRQALGVVTAPFYDRASRALKATLRIPHGHPDMAQILRLREVSIGVFSNEISESGEYGGRSYVGKVVGASPDHLAILSGEGVEGACSWEQNCGIRFNQQSYEVLQGAAMAVYHQISGGMQMSNFSESEETGAILTNKGDYHMASPMIQQAREATQQPKAKDKAKAQAKDKGAGDVHRNERSGGATLLPPGVE